MKRAVLLVALVLFVAFEASRAVWLGEFLLPLFERQKVLIDQIAAFPPWIAVLCFFLATVLFALPMAAVVFSLRWLHRRLFRNGTVVNILLTKVNFR